MSVLKFLLLPFAMLYDAIMDMRNRLYDMKLRPSTAFDIPVISVGNLAVGGTGKTPMVEYLIRLLSPTYHVVTLSRGYGRKTRGFRFAGDHDSARTLGDEPYQIYKKFKPTVQVTVCEDRALAIPMILQEFPETGVVIMDDAFQHRRVIPGFSVLLTEYQNLFYEDHSLPYGRLREGPEGATRADAIVVTKCPVPLQDDTIMAIERNIKKFSTKPIFFSTIRYGEPVAFGDPTKKISKNVILLTGIANAHVLEEHVKKNFRLVEHVAYRDHYYFKPSDLRRIEHLLQRDSQADVSILTTEKDKVKLEGEEFASLVSRLPLFYLPIEAEFIRSGKDFDALVISFMNSIKPD